MVGLDDVKKLVDKLEEDGVDHNYCEVLKRSTEDIADKCNSDSDWTWIMTIIMLLGNDAIRENRRKHSGE